MLTLSVQAIALTNSLDSIRDTHQFRELGSGAGLHVNFLETGSCFRRVGDASNALDQIGRQVPAVRHKHGQTIDSVVTLIPRIDGLVSRECAHCHFPLEIVNHKYRLVNQMSSVQISVPSEFP